jgi:N,N'-diacetyllegionaminate synthase
MSATAPPFIIAEAGVNHDGSLAKALRLVDIAADAGADAVKFQTFRTDEIVMPGTAKAAYQERQTGGGSQYDMIRALELDEAAHRAIAERCAERGIEFMSTPFDLWALDLLTGLGMKRIKIASGELTNKPLIEAVAGRGLPIILSTGMGSLAEVERAVGWIRAVWAGSDACVAERDLTVLHCTSNYPAEPEAINLKAMDTLAAALGVPIGYSDHSLGLAISIAAAARGATVIEKHFTEDPAADGPDHAASLAPGDLAALVQALRAVGVALGDGVKEPSPSELEVRALVRRSAFARRDIAAGTALAEGDIAFRRPSGGIGPEKVDTLFGSRTKRPIAAGEKLAWDDLAQ